MKFKELIFCAIDFSDLKESQKFLKRVVNHIGGIKIGLEFFLKNGLYGVQEVKKFGLPIFLDLKLKDIPSTVRKAAENVIDLDPQYLSVHLTGGVQMLNELISIKENTKILGVSMLTSLDNSDLRGFGIEIDSHQYVENLANVGLKAGIDGLVSSALEIPNLKRKIKKKIIYVTPGIRLPDDNINDQKRIISPGMAVNNGASILIIGRTITESVEPIETIKKISRNIEECLES
jgi:orotidine-5'-phosphate decarboxylase